MQLRPAEVTDILKKELKRYRSSLKMENVGTVLTVGDGVARVYGLDQCMMSEILEFPHGVFGMALNLEQDNVGAVLFGAEQKIKEGDEVRTTGRLISVPTGVKVFNWVSTMWQGSMTFETPMLFAIGFVVLFTIGGLSGLMLAITAADFQYHDTYFVVAHFHYVLVPGAVFALMAATYYWLPKFSGNMYSEKWGKIHFWTSAIFVNVLFFPQHYLGLAGMPRRIPDYSPQFADFNMISSIGGFAFGVTQLIFVGVIVHCVYRSKVKATPEVWEASRGLEWTLYSPPAYHSFTTPPVVSYNMVTHTD